MDTWSNDVTRRLLDRTICPRCGSPALDVGRCRACDADLSSPVAQQVLEASFAAVKAIEHRQTLLDSLPNVVSATSTALPPPTTAPSPGAAPTSAVTLPPPRPPSALTPARGGGGSQLTIQSVLAAAGAGLFAVAAIVFTFFNPDVDFAARTSIIGVVTALFLGGAWLFAVRGLRFSAEAVGALGMVFLALDIWAFADAAPPGVNGWVFAAIGTLVASALMITVAALVRLRVWLWLSLVGLVLTPAFVGWSTVNWWGATIGHVAAGFVALGAHEVIKRLAPRFGSDLRADRSTATVLQLFALFWVVVALPFLPETDSGALSRAIGTAVILGFSAVAAGLATRNQLPRFWSLVAGALAVSAVAVVPLAFAVQVETWNLALVPGAAAAAFVGAAAVRATGPVRRIPLLIGGLSVTLLAATAAAGLQATIILSAAFSATDAYRTTALPLGLEAELAIPALVGLAAVALGVWAVSRLTADGFALGMAVLARWVAGFAALGAAVWPGAELAWQVAAALALALLASLALLFVPRIRSSRLELRAPVIVTSFAALLLGIAMSWNDQIVGVIAGAASLVVTLAIALTLPRPARAVLMGLGFAYALVVFAAALDLTTLETLPILCLTATFGAVVALTATLTPWLRPATWYAVLIVSTIPFLIAVGVLFVEIAGWTALSTGTMFLLAVALMVTRRPGLTLFLRAAAAATLVPSLAVVVIALGAALLESSGSPYALPIIGVIVAVTLPTTGLIAATLEHRTGLSEAHARIVRFWIELSTLVTAAIAVVLAFWRPAAGADTALLVFALVGLGGAATAFWAHRRYGWIVAAVAWTGGLWTALGIAGVQVEFIEPYALPPALVAALVGAILVARGNRAAVTLYAAGLGAAITPSLVVLAIAGSGADAVAPWRAFGLLGGAALLLAVGVLVRGRAGAEPGRWAGLRFPTLVFAVVAAAGGAFQAIRYGFELDPIPVALDPAAQMLVVLAFSIAAAALGAAAGRVATTGNGAAEPPTRWWYLAPAAYLVSGPMTAIRAQPLEIWTLWALMIALLGLVVLTAVRSRTRAVTLPPIWFTFGLAWVTGVVGWSQGVGWSQREVFRIEAWSLPMGFALLAAGIVAMPAVQRQLDRVTLNDWPIGFRGSWKLLGPGLVVIFLPSIIATFSVAETWRAILVIALALVSVLAGAFLKLRAPFILGLTVLVLENVFVLAIQVGRGVESIPWWITLATAGAALLAIAIRSERRTGKDASVGARLRDLE